jgi:hypothetical protein
LWLIAMALSGVGCASPIPTYPWEGPKQALEHIRLQSTRVHSFSGECQIILSRKGNVPVRLRGAMAVRMPTHVRLRAWKFQTPVLDFTSRPDGLWLWISERAGGDLGFKKADGPSRSLPSVWTPGGPAWLHDASSTVVDDGTDQFEVHHVPSGTDGVRLVAGIDRATRTVRRYEVWIHKKMLHRLELQGHRMFDVGPWPTRWIFESSDQVMKMELQSFDFNVTLPDAAFRPATGAERIR